MKMESDFEMFLSSDDQCSKNSKTSCVDDNMLSSDTVINGNRKDNRENQIKQYYDVDRAGFLLLPLSGLKQLDNT